MKDIIEEIGGPIRATRMSAASWRGEWPLEPGLRLGGGTPDLPWSLLLLGPPGTGKTHLGTAVLRSEMAIHGSEPFFAEGHDGAVGVIYHGRWVDARALAGQLRDAVGERRVGEIRERLSAYRCLLLDDLPEEPSEFVREVFDAIIGRRYDRCLTTILTANLPSWEAVEVAYGARVASRLAEGEVLVRSGDDWRLHRWRG